MSSYRPQSDQRGQTISFDIERSIEWDRNYNLLPFTYSFMIDVTQPLSELRETQNTTRDFREKVENYGRGIRFEDIVKEINFDPEEYFYKKMDFKVQQNNGKIL